MPRGVSKRSPVARNEAVDEQGPGDVGRRGDREIEPAKRRRYDPKHRIEDEDEYQREPEIGQRAGQQAVIVCDLAQNAALVAGSRHPQRQADQHRHQQRQRNQFERCRKTLREIGRDRHGRLPGRAEISVDHLPQIDARTARRSSGPAPIRRAVAPGRRRWQTDRASGPQDRRVSASPEGSSQAGCRRAAGRRKSNGGRYSRRTRTASYPAPGMTAGCRLRCNCPASARRRAGSANTSTLEPISEKPKMVIASAKPGKIDGHQWPVMMFW